MIDNKIGANYERYVEREGSVSRIIRIVYNLCECACAYKIEQRWH